MEFSKWWVNDFKTVKFPSTGTVFDYYIDSESKKFVPWTERVPKFEFDPESPLQVSSGKGVQNGGIVCHCYGYFSSVPYPQTQTEPPDDGNNDRLSGVGRVHQHWN